MTSSDPQFSSSRWVNLIEEHSLFCFEPDHALWLPGPGSTGYAESLLFPGLQRSEVFGFVAGFGTKFAAVLDLVSMLKRRSRAGMNPMMAAIMGSFQILWVYYGFLIASRPVITWNAIAVLINFLTIGAFCYFGDKKTK